MKKCILFLNMLSLALAGCGKSPEPAPEDTQRGSIVFECSVSSQVSVVASGTKADPATRELPASCLPTSEQMALHICGCSSSFESHYETMADYDQPLLDPGDYTIEFSYGDPEAEGPDAACFSGTSTCTVVARTTVTHPVVHTLANALYTVELSDWFKNYYSEYHVSVHTESGYQSDHTSDEETTRASTEPTPIFVKPSTKLYLSGTAVKTNGVQVEIPKTEIGTTVARTWHTIRVDAGSTGQASLTLLLDDKPTAIETIEIELNPEI